MEFGFTIVKISMGTRPGYKLSLENVRDYFPLYYGNKYPDLVVHSFDDRLLVSYDTYEDHEVIVYLS